MRSLSGHLHPGRPSLVLKANTCVALSNLKVTFVYLLLVLVKLSRTKVRTHQKHCFGRGQPGTQMFIPVPGVLLNILLASSNALGL